MTRLCYGLRLVLTNLDLRLDNIKRPPGTVSEQVFLVGQQRTVTPNRVPNNESLAMLRDVRERQTLRSSVQPASVGAAAPGRGEQLDHIDIMFKKTQLLAEQQAEHAEKAL